MPWEDGVALTPLPEVARYYLNCLVADAAHTRRQGGE